MNQNQQYEMNNSYPVQGQYQVRPSFQIPQEYGGLFIGFIICIVVMIVACLMPLYTMEGESINYLYNTYNTSNNSAAMAYFALGIADGICLIALGIAALVALVKKKPMVSAICQSAGVVLFLNQWLKMNGIMEMSKKFEDEQMSFGTGFYLIAIALIASTVMAWMIWRKVTYGVTFPRTQAPMYQQPIVPQPQPQVADVQPTVEQNTVEQKTEPEVENKE